MDAQFREKFLTNTDDTGRFIVTSQRTGKVYYVEPLMGRHKTPEWGDIDPATKKVTGSYGKKYKGAVENDESMITSENGFVKIHELPVGTSPHHAIEVIDAAYPDKE